MSPSDFGAARRILIVKPSSLGDIVHTLPLLGLLRRQAPHAEIRWLVNEIWAPLLQGHPMLDGVIEFPRHAIRGWAAPGRLLQWIQAQSHWRPDISIDVQGLLRSVFLARTFRPRQLIGYSDAREGASLAFDERIDIRQVRSPHAVDRYLALAQALGWEIPDPLPFPLPPGQMPVGAGDLPGRFVLVHPFSRGRGKSLTVDQVERLFDALDGIPVVLVGRAEVGEGRLGKATVNWLNQTSLPELIWLLRRASWTLSVDSGPMHLAAAVSPRVLSLHTWSDPLKVGPYPGDAWAWKDGQIRSMADWRRLGTGPVGVRGDGEFPSEAIDAIAGHLREKWEDS